MHIFTVTYVKLYKLIDFFFFADLFGEHLGLYKIKSFYFIHDRTQYFYVCHVLTIVKWESHFYNGNLVWAQHWCFCTPPCLSTDINLYLVCWASFHFSPKIDVHKTFLTRHKVWDQIQHAFCYHHHWIHTPFHENGCSVVVFFFLLLFLLHEDQRSSNWACPESAMSMLSTESWSCDLRRDGACAGS